MVIFHCYVSLPEGNGSKFYRTKIYKHDIKKDPWNSNQPEPHPCGRSEIISPQESWRTSNRHQPPKRNILSFNGLVGKTTGNHGFYMFLPWLLPWNIGSSESASKFPRKTQSSGGSLLATVGGGESSDEPPEF